MLARHMDGTQALDAGTHVDRQCVPGMRHADEPRRDRWRIHLDPVQGDGLHGTVVPHHVAVEEELPEGRIPVLVAVGYIVLVDVGPGEHGGPFDQRILADQKAGQIRLGRSRDLELTK